MTSADSLNAESSEPASGLALAQCGAGAFAAVWMLWFYKEESLCASWFPSVFLDYATLKEILPFRSIK